MAQAGVLAFATAGRHNATYVRCWIRTDPSNVTYVIAILSQLYRIDKKQKELKTAHSDPDWRVALEVVRSRVLENSDADGILINEACNDVTAQMGNLN